MSKRQIKICLMCSAAVVATLFFVYTLLAQRTLSAQEKAESEEAMPLPETTEASNITVDFKDADIRDVLRIISFKSGVNIVASNDVAGLVTIRLVNVEWERALDVILKNNNFVYERDKDIIRVMTIENLGKEELATEIFILNYAQAAEVAAAISEIVSERGRVKFDSRTNQVILTDIPTNIYKIGKVIAGLDRKTAQVMIEAKIIETVLDDDERLGIDWTALASATGSVRPLLFPFAVDKTYGKTGKKYFPRVNQTGDFASSVENGFPFAQTTDFTFGTLSFGQFQAVLEILKTRSDTKTLSNPRIVTLNNNEAVIHVGRNYNIPLYERNDSTGQMEITDYEERDIGIKLTVTPHVNAQGEIVVDLKPEITSFLQFDDYGNVQAPVFTARRATTRVRIKDGETIVIGGLIKEEVVDYVKKIPFLGDLPILKYVFSKREKTIDTTDLMIFVTVRLMDSEGLNFAKQAEAGE